MAPSPCLLLAFSCHLTELFLQLPDGSSFSMEAASLGSYVFSYVSASIQFYGGGGARELAGVSVGNACETRQVFNSVLDKEVY